MHRVYRTPWGYRASEYPSLVTDELKHRPTSLTPKSRAHEVNGKSGSGGLKTIQNGSLERNWFLRVLVSKRIHPPPPIGSFHLYRTVQTWQTPKMKQHKSDENVFLLPKIKKCTETIFRHRSSTRIRHTKAKARRQKAYGSSWRCSLLK